jgi:bifunctional oligoribonuclease and PAP phosphatase NrnA
MSSVDLTPLAQILSAASHVLLVIHERPDADALGSVLGLALALEQGGKAVQVGCADPMPERYRFLPKGERVTDQVQCAPLALILDANQISRLGALAAVVQTCPQIAVLDHHPLRPNDSALIFADERAAATALLVYELLPRLGAQLTPEIAACLYCGLAGDTGFFTFQNTNAEVLSVAAELVATGADPYEIHRRSQARLPLSAIRLRGYALMATEVAGGGRLAYSVLRRGDFLASGAGADQTEGVVDLLRSVAGAEVFVLFTQTPEGDWRLSFRSEHLDVGRVAQELGGGGHKTAAGCRLTGDEPTVVELVRRRVQDALEGSD